MTLLGGDALKLHQRTAALLATLPRVDPRELHALGDALGGSDRVALAAFIDSVDRWVSARLHADDANANANLPRLHGWRRCGKRSTAPRATPNPTTLSENRWFSRCSGCLRKRRDKRSARFHPRQPGLSNKGYCGGDTEEENFEKSSVQKAAHVVPRRQGGGREEARQAPGEESQENRQEGQQESREEGWQEGRPEDREDGGKEDPQGGCEAGRRKAGEEDRGEGQIEDRRRAERATGRQKGGHEAGRQGRAKSRAYYVGVGCGRPQHFLHHDRDRLSERCAAYRPRL